MPNDLWLPFAEGRTPERFPAGALIYMQGAAADRFYYLRAGSAKSFLTSPDGDERMLTIHRAGSLMGEASFFDGEPRLSSSVALSHCEVFSIDRDRLTEVFSRHPELAFSMLQYLAKTVRLLSGHVDSMSFLGAERRVAQYLLSLTAGPDGALSCTHEEIGFAVGASRVTVSRILADWRRRGLIETGYRSVRPLRARALSRLAAPASF